MVETVVFEVALFRFGVNRFENRVNSLLKAGWKIKSCFIEKRFCRYLCQAILEK